jgi:hypothetical protein
MAACDAAQASIFAQLLQTEVCDLGARLRDAERRWAKRQARSTTAVTVSATSSSVRSVDTPASLIRLREQVEEAATLLASLRGRSRR